MGLDDDPAPVAFVTVTSLKGPEVEVNKAAIASLTPILEKGLGVPKARTYIEFRKPKGSNFGANGKSMDGVFD